MLHRLVLAALAISAASFMTALPSWAQMSPDLSGRWVWAVEGRTVFIIDIPDRDSPVATLTRPSSLVLLQDGALSGVDGPVFTEDLKVNALTADHITLTRPNDEVYEIRLAAKDWATFAFVGGPPMSPLSLYRPHDPATVETDWGGDRAYGRLEPDTDVSDDPAVKALFDADQADRDDMLTVGPQVAVKDAARRAELTQLMQAGVLKSGRDYYRAAFIYQHGDQPDDYLLAHVLAVTAMAKGFSDAGWIAAAALDRYLHESGSAQIYGTQFQIPFNGDPVTQRSYNRDLLPDSARIAVGVPTLAGQEEQRQSYERERAARSSSVRN